MHELLRLDFWVLEGKFSSSTFRLWYTDVLGEINYCGCFALFWLMFLSEQPYINCHKIVWEIVMHCFAWMGRCALCVLQVVNMEHQGDQCGRIVWWHHLVAWLLFRWCWVAFLWMAKTCKYNDFYILNLHYFLSFFLSFFWSGYHAQIACSL